MAKAHVVALQRLLKRTNEERFEVYNLGTGTGSSVLEVINSYERISGNRLKYQLVDRRPGDVITAFASTTKTNEILGWKTESSLDEAMKSAWDWEQKVRKKTESYNL